MSDSSDIEKILREHRGRVLTYSELYRKQHHNPSRYEADLAHADSVILSQLQELMVKELKVVQKAGNNWHDNNEGTKYELDKRITDLDNQLKGVS